MATVFRWLMRLFIGVVALSVAVLGLAYYLAGRSLPDYDRDYRVTGATGEIEIVRDSHNVPHVFAKTDRDAYFGLGFTHAQDRLWQMTMMRRTAQGRMSEIFGERTLNIDDFLRRLDLYGLSETAVQYQGAEEQAILQAYANGVNAWIETVRAEALGRGAPEFFLFSQRLQPWRPADSIAIMRLMELQLTGHLKAEVLRAQISLALAQDPERIKDILPDAPGPGALSLPAYSQLFPDLPMQETAKYMRKDPMDPVPELAFAGASNIFAAAPSRSSTQTAILANDPHLGLTAPSIWMLARLSLSTGDVIGGTIPGMPAILVGRSEHLAWGLTSAYLDGQDLHVEQLNPDNPDEYRSLDGFRPFTTRRIQIDVKGSDPVNRTLRWTENGPVLPGYHYDLASITPAGHVMSVSWTILKADDQSMTAALRLMRAQTVPEAIAAGELLTAPAQNLVLTDRDNIAYQLLGKMPNRDPDHQSEGRLPTPGWLAENRWDGFLPYENNPRVINPAGGLLANTNNKTVDRPFPNHVTHLWGDAQRIERLQKLMGSREVHSRASFVEAQLDQVSFSARALLPLVAKDLWFMTEAPGTGTANSLRQQALSLLADWNGEMNEHLPEPLIYAAWMRSLQQALVQDELGPLARQFKHAEPVFIERVFRDIGGAAAWCDIRQSSPVETCTEIARQSLDTALLELVENYGNRVSAWRWGDAHQAAHDHQVLGDLPLLGWLFNIRQSTSGGDNTLLRGLSSGEEPTPYFNVHAAGYRGVYDMGDPDASVFIISTGQSGHFLSRHYDDLAQLWRRGEYVQMSLDPDLARAAAVGVSRLLPVTE